MKTIDQLFPNGELASPAAIRDAGYFPSPAQIEYALGLDLGQTFDPTAAALLEMRQEPLAEIDPQTLRQRLGRKIVNVRGLWRYPLQTPYPAIVRDIALRLGDTRIAGARLAIDQTGVGRPVFDLFAQAGLRPVGITITGGSDFSQVEVDQFRVAKILLVSVMQSLLHAGEIKIAKSLPDASVLVSELQDFRANISETGYASFGARSGKHDDLVLAVSVAGWWLLRAPRREIHVSTFDGRPVH